MPWVRLDDHIDEHGKFARVGPLGLALFVCGLAYCNRNLTDGHIPAGTARTLIGVYVPGRDGDLWTLMPGRPLDTQPLATASDDLGPQDIIDALVTEGLWERERGGYYVHDYPDYQPTRAQIEAEREQKRAAGQAGGKARAKAAARAVAKARAEANAKQGAKHDAEQGAKHDLKQNPSPYPREKNSSSEISDEISSSSQEPDDDFDGTEPPDPPADLTALLTALQPTPNQRARWLLAASTEPDRTRACLTAAGRAERPAAYLDQLIRKGDWPTPHRSEPRPAEITPEEKRAALLRSLRKWATCHEALEYPEESIREELARRARRADTTLTPAEEHDLITAWAAARPAATVEKQEPEAA